MSPKPRAPSPRTSFAATFVAVGVAAIAPACAPSMPAPPPASAATQPVAEPPPATPVAAASELRAERIPIRFSDVTRVEDALTDILDLNREESGSVRALLVDHDTQEIVVVGTPAGIELVRTILGPALVDADPTARDVVVLRLSHRHASDVARALASVAAPDVVIVPDSAANALVVRARPEERAKIAAWVSEVDVAPLAP